MTYLVVLLITIIIISILVMVLLANNRSSNDISRDGNLLTISHPLKKEVINLDSDLKSWNVQSFRRLWWGRIYGVSLETKSGKWKKLYTRILSGNIGALITYLEETAPEKRRES